MTDWLDQLKWNEAGLVPAIAQDAETGVNLMVAWMNRDALQETVDTKRAVYFSRSRQKLWRKGEESGHHQEVVEVRLDCDADVILLKVHQKGGISCHTGRHNCFYRIYSDGSYVASLYNKGLDAILKKVGEEATETVMAAKDGDAQKIVYEVADLWFHTMVLLAQQGLEPQQVIDELARRMGVSGIEEKASRIS